MRPSACSSCVQLTCWLALGLAACLPPAAVELSEQPGGVQAPKPSGPRYARSRASVLLYADPSHDADHVELQAGPGAPAERVVELIEADPSGAWWRVRTQLPRQALALGLDPGLGMAVLQLEGWVEARRLVEFDPSGAAPAQAKDADAGAGAGAGAGTAPARGSVILFKVAAGTSLRWPDGRVAGEAAEDHCFHAPATLMQGESGEQRLLCHERRAASGVGVIEGWLCTSEGEAFDRGVVAPTVVALDEPSQPSPSGPERAAGAEVKGALDREAVRAIVRAHIDEVRNCYNLGLLVDPALAGRVTINFVISGGGTVSSAIVSDDSLTDAAVGQCIAKAVATWVFPKPRGGGNVIITYPFNLTPG